MKTLLLHNATIISAEKEAVGSLYIKDGKISDVIYQEQEDYPFMVMKLMKEASETMELEGRCIMAGGVDAHVHFREPGFEYKEDIASGSRCASAGGVTSVFTMPGVSPA